MSAAPKTLVALDFDHTIIEDNSDVVIKQLAPGGKIPHHIKTLFRDNDWTEFMGAIFKYLHSNGTQPTEIKHLMQQLPFVSGMTQLFDYLRANSDSHQVIIISDSNSIFIDYVMTYSGVSDVITKTYTNPSWFDDSGCLCIKYYHTQDWCNLSTKNLCKGWILNKHIEEQAKLGETFETVVYVGDGSNDLCPGLKLRSQDYLMPRIGFKLMSILEDSAREYKVEAKVKPWTDGCEVVELLRSVQPPCSNTSAVFSALV